MISPVFPEQLIRLPEAVVEQHVDAHQGQLGIVHVQAMVVGVQLLGHCTVQGEPIIQLCRLCPALLSPTQISPPRVIGGGGAGRGGAPAALSLSLQS